MGAKYKYIYHNPILHLFMLLLDFSFLATLLLKEVALFFLQNLPNPLLECICIILLLGEFL